MEDEDTGGRWWHGWLMVLVPGETNESGGGGSLLRLLKQSSIAEGGHDVTNRRGTHPFFIVQLARHGLRGDGLTGRDIDFDDCVQDQPVARANPKLGRHCPPPQERLIRASMYDQHEVAYLDSKSLSVTLSRLGRLMQTAWGSYGTLRDCGFLGADGPQAGARSPEEVALQIVPEGWPVRPR